MSFLSGLISSVPASDIRQLGEKNSVEIFMKTKDRPWSPRFNPTMNFTRESFLSRRLAVVLHLVGDSFPVHEVVRRRVLA